MQILLNLSSLRKSSHDSSHVLPNIKMEAAIPTEKSSQFTILTCWRQGRNCTWLVILNSTNSSSIKISQLPDFVLLVKARCFSYFKIYRFNELLPIYIFHLHIFQRGGELKIFSSCDATRDLIDNYIQCQFYHTDSYFLSIVMSGSARWPHPKHASGDTTLYVCVLVQQVAF